jgi:hypothetical protein
MEANDGTKWNMIFPQRFVTPVKKEELRIGNWVKWYSVFIQVESILNNSINYEYYANDDEVCETPIQQIEAIPLTPEILEKAGFVEGDAYRDATGYWKGIYFVCNNWFLKATGKGHFNILNGDLRYVHQLQNLYFCLCGEELDIKL